MPVFEAKTAAVGVVRSLNKLKNGPLQQQVARDAARHVPALAIRVAVPPAHAKLIRLRDKQRISAYGCFGNTGEIGFIPGANSVRLVHYLLAQRVVVGS